MLANQTAGWQQLPAGDRIAAAPGQRLKLDRVPAGDDVDIATDRTIRMMASYIRQAIADPLIQQCARYAFERFGGGVDSIEAKTWAVFWYVKHCVKFRRDEGVMIELGSPGEQDVLIAPSVLARMAFPSEDCDGFTMFAASLLACLGVPVALVAVAVNPRIPNVWSHVFPVAIAGGRVQPIDTSHGSRPGWMVPSSRISRWQAWDLSGQRIDLPAPEVRQSLHGFGAAPVRIQIPRFVARRRRGLGDDAFSIATDPEGTAINYGSTPLTTTGDTAWDPTIGYGSTPLTTGGSSGGVSPMAGGSGSGMTCSIMGCVSNNSGGASPSSSSNNGSWINSLLGGSFNLAGRVLAPATTTCNAAGVCTSVNGSPLPASSAINPTTLLLVAGVAALLLFAGKK